jgi:hypothetical protein
MAARRHRRPSDPFHPRTPGEQDEVPLSEAADVPERRAPVKYRRPGVSWVTVVVLGFAAVGVAAVAGSAFKRVGRMAFLPSASKAPAPVVYNELAKDSSVLVSIQVTPASARLILDGEPLSSNPVRLSRGTHKIAATAGGFSPLVQEFTADAPKTLRLKLTRAKR